MTRAASLRGRAICAVACAAILCGGCNKSAAASTASTTAPSVPVVVTPFSGSVDVGSSSSNGFTVTNTGPVSATLTAVGPPDSVVMGLAIGVPSDSGACVALPGASVDTGAGAGAQISGILSPDQYCLVVFDVGNATGTVSYTVNVSHP